VVADHQGREREDGIGHFVADMLGRDAVKLPRRNFLYLAAGAAALPTASRIAWAQAYPSRPVRIIVGFAPGGAYDIVARLMSQFLSERLGQQFVVENRPGASGTIGTEAVVKAPSDGYTLLLVGAAAVTSALLYDKLSFNLIRDITPVTGIISIPFIMAVNPSVPAKTVPELIDYAKANSGQGQHGLGRQRNGRPSVGRAVQDDGPRQHGPRSLSRRGTCTH
jgi:tripartite-type tricarboxylate transporter receptor subunit TctC